VATGLRRETINRLLKKWQADRVVRLDPRGLRDLDLAALGAILGPDRPLLFPRASGTGRASEVQR
jgi:hypothetical protein